MDECMLNSTYQILMAVHNEKMMPLILVMHCCHPFNLLSPDSHSVFFIALPRPLLPNASYLDVPFHYSTKPSLWSSSFSPTWRLNPLSFQALIPPLHVSAPSQLSAKSLFLYISKTARPYLSFWFTRSSSCPSWSLPMKIFPAFKLHHLCHRQCQHL